MQPFESLKLSKEFNYFYNKSKKHHTSNFIVFYNPTEHSKVGFTASKKVGNAVKRNLAKRRMRALVRIFTPLLKSGTYIIVAKEPIIDADFSKLQKEFRYACKRVGALQAHDTIART